MGRGGPDVIPSPRRRIAAILRKTSGSVTVGGKPCSALEDVTMAATAASSIPCCSALVLTSFLGVVLSLRVGRTSRRPLPDLVVA